ncbi:unnamed protein product [Lathyrus oleraceus]
MESETSQFQHEKENADSKNQESEEESSHGKISYKNMVTGETSGKKDDHFQIEKDVEETEDSEDNIRIEEHKLKDYECLEFALSVLEERQIAKPWEKGVIIKMLGRRIDFKALENRL